MTDDTNALITESIDLWTLKHLENDLKATDEDEIYFARLQDLRDQKRISSLYFDYTIPSVVIDDFLYLGDMKHASDMNLLMNLSIRHIVNTCHLPLKTEVTKNFNVLWINLQDDEDVNINQYFEQTNDFLLSCKQKNEKVLVHCEMGISRSSSIVLAYLMKYHHDTLMKAYEYLLERRVICSPNAGFCMQLIQYEKTLRKSGAIDEQQNNDDKQNPIKPIDLSGASNVE